MVLIIARTNFDAKLLPPFQIIIPSLGMTGPFSLYTSMGHQIHGDNKYEALIENLRSTEGESSLTYTLKLILKERPLGNFRVCILGGDKVNWDIVLEYKRKGIMIDTAAVNLMLSQVSYTTGGIARKVGDSTIIRDFLTIFTMSKTMRSCFMLEENKKITFHMECKCCTPPTVCKEEFFACSVCLSVYCRNRAVLAR